LRWKQRWCSTAICDRSMAGLATTLGIESMEMLGIIDELR
jgi:hypothetical protein